MDGREDDADVGWDGFETICRHSSRECGSSFILDSYHCHMMNSVVNAIQDLGVEVKHIPGGCTSLCQPVDIGINQPFKAYLCQAWEKWMIDEGIRSVTTSPPTRELIAQWTAYAKDQIKEMHIRNAWRHEPYSWFPTCDTDEMT